MRHSVALFLLLVVSPAVPAAADTSSPPKRVRSVALGATDLCPPSVGDEVVVCYTEDEPYRIPKRFRQTREIPAANQSWANRVATIDEIGRVAGGLPNTCSVVGTGGQTGCTQAMLRAWAAERRQMAREAEDVP